MGQCNIDLDVIAADCNTVEVSTSSQPIVTGVTGGDEVSWKEAVITVTEPSQRVFHEKLKRLNIKKIGFTDGNGLRWEKAGAIREVDGDGKYTGWMDFTPAGITIYDEFLFEYK